MDFAQAAAHDEVIDGLRSIEDKIQETGQLVTATGAPESDVKLSFLTVDLGRGPTPYLVIDISTQTAADQESDVWMSLNDDIFSKYLDLSGSLPRRVASALGEAAGQLTRVNGTPTLLSNW